jgi:alcohol dehydrogenase (cytochrome c)
VEHGSENPCLFETRTALKSGSPGASTGFGVSWRPTMQKRQGNSGSSTPIPGPGEFGHDTRKNDAWRTRWRPNLDHKELRPIPRPSLFWRTRSGPWFSARRSSRRHLFTDSLIALHARSGKLAWYFQFTPHDEHDWDSTQTPALAAIPIKAVLHQSIFVANRNGFDNVLDRTTGEFLVGVPFVQQKWAKGLDSGGRTYSLRKCRGFTLGPP